MQQKKVLIAPLDWGLGHATRCIPVITAFIELGYHVTIATEGAHEIILREAFPGLTFLRLKGYGIRYSKKAAGFTFKMIVQIPRILYNIFREFWWLYKTNRHQQFDLIVCALPNPPRCREYILVRDLRVVPILVICDRFEIWSAHHLWLPPRS